MKSSKWLRDVVADMLLDARQAAVLDKSDRARFEDQLAAYLKESGGYLLSLELIGRSTLLSSVPQLSRRLSWTDCTSW